MTRKFSFCSMDVIGDIFQYHPIFLVINTQKPRIPIIYYKRNNIQKNTIKSMFFVINRHKKGYFA